METGDGTSNGDNPEHAADRSLNSGGVNNGMVVEVGVNGFSEEVGGLNNNTVYNGKEEGVSNGVGIVDGNGVAEFKRGRCLKNETAKNGVEIAEGFTVAKRAYGGFECLRTYKRRKHVKLSCSESKLQEHSRKPVEAASHLSNQETFKIDTNGQECSSQFANRKENGMHHGCSSELDGHGVTKKCQRVLCNILASEKFSSLRKVLLENFQGVKPESVFDFSFIHSRMKEKVYEQSPTQFWSDIQKVWEKLEDTGSEIVAIAKSLSILSRAYCEQAGVSVQSSFEEEKRVFCNGESNSHMKPEQTEECATDKTCICKHCGGKADGIDCLVCDSCEEIYHLSCIEPAVKEIPHKSWFCAKCTACGVGSPHENCVVCERLNIPKTGNNIAGVESILTNEETLIELEENSNCTYTGAQVSTGSKKSRCCKICTMAVDGEKIKICGHRFCPSKYYHVRCLSSMQIKSNGPCWFCPSCLCRVCLKDRDDTKIVLCDGCDHAYHIYCLKPPLAKIPRGTWFCKKCGAGIQAIREAKRAYDMKWNNKLEREPDKVGGMDMLLTAANTLNLEENLAAFQVEAQT